MSDFIANIKAVLDTSKLQGQINDVGKNTKITFNNFAVDASKVVSEIQSALSKTKFTINLDTSGLLRSSGGIQKFGASITNQMQRVGVEAGKSVSTAFNSALNSITLKNGNIKNVKSALQGFGFDEKSVVSATKGLDQMLVTVNKIQTARLADGNLKITISGIDEIGRAVNVVREFDGATNEIVATTKKFTQSFGVSASEASKFAAQVEKANSAIKSNAMTKSIAEVSSQYDKLSVSGHQSLTQIQSDIESLKALQASVSTSANDKVLVESYAAFNAQLEKVKNNLAIVKAESANAATAASRLDASARDAGTALKTGYIDSAISKVTAQYEQLGATGHQNLTTISNDIGRLKQLQSEMLVETDGAKLAKKYDEFDITLRKVQNNLKGVTAENKTFITELQVATLDNKMSTWLEKNSNASKTYGASIADLRKKLSQLTIGKSTTSDLKEIENGFNKVKQAAIQTGDIGKSVGDKLKGAFSSLARYFSVSTVVYQAVNAMKQMYQSVRDIDSAMTELKKVTDESTATYNAFQKNVGKAAKEIGTTIPDLINSTSDFARLGYNFKDSQELAKVANIYSVVGDEIESTEDATKSLISTMTAFKKEMNVGESFGEFGMSIIDKFNEVDILASLYSDVYVKDDQIGKLPDMDNSEERLRQYALLKNPYRLNDSVWKHTLSRRPPFYVDEDIVGTANIM